MPQFLLMLCLAVVLCVSATTQAQTPQVLQWELVPGLIVEGHKMYIDMNSVSRTQSDTLDAATGSFLLVPEEGGLQFKNKDGKLITALSLVRLMAVDCKNGAAIPIMDLYFDTKTPVKESRPIGKIDYSNNVRPIDIRPKSSVLFKTLCPKYPT